MTSYGAYVSEYILISQIDAKPLSFLNVGMELILWMVCQYYAMLQDKGMGFLLEWHSNSTLTIFTFLPVLCNNMAF